MWSAFGGDFSTPSCSLARLILLVVTVVALSLISLDVGASGYTLLQLLNGSAPRVILELRMVRTVAALAAGLVLGSAGLLLQYSLRNPLADPYLLGVSPAAMLAVELYALSVPGVVGFYAELGLVAAFGGLAGLAVTLLLSRFAASETTTILAGVAVSTSLSGAAYALDYLAAEKLGWPPSYVLFGGFAGVLSSYVLLLASLTAVTALVSLLLAPRLEALLYGDDAALLMGVQPRIMRIASLVVAGVSVSILTGYIGVIGFVGLIAPNAARRLLKCVEGVGVAAASMLMGSVVTLVADIVARILGPVSGIGELPAGALIAAAGGIVLAVLVARG